ncbi:MAG: sulfotransferase [Candidatus Hydrogenedentota bacterium]
MDRDYVLICSSGRSGSNWLLDILDLSGSSFVRNEPDECGPNATFGRLTPARAVIGKDEMLLESEWDTVLDTTAKSLGIRDHIASSHKHYVRPVAKTFGLDILMRKHRTRMAIANVIWPLRGEEWRLPGWLVDKSLLGETTPIFKLNNPPGWAVWALRNRPKSRVIHLVRHPGGFLNSWSNRYLSRHNESKVLGENRQRLRDVAAIDVDWGARFGDVDAMDVEAAEMWYWLYANESLYVEGRNRGRYLPLTFERLAAEPLATAQDAFEFCGLEWNNRIQDSVREMSEQSQQIAKAWRSQLTREQVTLVERILGDSPLADLWPEEAA